MITSKRQIQDWNDVSQPEGCCLMSYISHRKDYTTKPSRIRVYSQPRQSKEKKIDLTIGRKRHSESKEPHLTNATYLRTPSKDMSPRRTLQNMREFTTAASKATTIAPSLKTSSIGSGKNQLKIECSFNQKGISTNSFKYSPPKREKIQQQTKKTQQNVIQSTSIQMISDISIVQEEFISHTSATLNLLNFINKPPQNIDRPQNPVFTQQPHNINTIQIKKPLKTDQQDTVIRQKMMDRKRYDKKIDAMKKRLIL